MLLWLCGVLFRIVLLALPGRGEGACCKRIEGKALSLMGLVSSLLLCNEVAAVECVVGTGLLLPKLRGALLFGNFGLATPSMVDFVLFSYCRPPMLEKNNGGLLMLGALFKAWLGVLPALRLLKALARLIG